MCKLWGLCLVVLCGVGAGVLVALRLSRTRTALDALCQLLRALSTEMAFTTAPIQSLLSGLAMRPGYGDFSFPGCVAAALEQGETLSRAWRQSLTADGAVPGCARVLLMPLGDELGASDLAGQTRLLEQHLARLDECRQHYAASCPQRQRLALCMGTLGGLLAAILLC